MILTPAQRICRIIIYNMQSPHTAADVYSVHETAHLLIIKRISTENGQSLSLTEKYTVVNVYLWSTNTKLIIQ